MFRKSPKKSPNKNYDAIHQKYIQVTADYEDMQIQFQSLKEQFHKVKQEKEACQRETKAIELRENEMRQKFKGESEAIRLQHENEIIRLKEEIQRFQEKESKYIKIYVSLYQNPCNLKHLISNVYNKT